ncbi:MAG: hypothetical protein D6732_19115 [Methanobacteriota archaeon]|nr:MAG: hypothetical protein D6732_19115 [Euryarchaeota archaeon]
MATILKKIVILGTTGSGKTTFLRNIAGQVDDAEVTRRVVIEEAQVLNTFTAIDKDLFKDSTTTVAMNVRNVLFATTMSNQFRFFSISQNANPEDWDELDNLFPTLIIDTAGQERFEFMQEIGVKGADAALVFADGTNIQSIERIRHFCNIIQEEANRSGKTIPVAIFVNKKDLADKGYYVGKQPLEDLENDHVGIYETTNTDPETFFPALRQLLFQITGFPIDISQINIKSVREVY